MRELLEKCSAPYTFHNDKQKRLSKPSPYFCILSVFSVFHRV